MTCVRTHACPHPKGAARFVTEQKHNFTLETREPLLVYDPVLFWWSRPHVTGTVWSTPGVRTNSLGLRGPEIGSARANVLVVGDSVVWGSLVEEHERFTDVAAAICSRDGFDLQIINAGMVGFSSHQVCQYLRTRGLRQFSPRVVVVCVGVNDAWRAAASDRTEAAVSSTPAARLRRLARHSSLFLFLERYLTEGALWLRTGRNPDGLSFLYPSHAEGATTLRAAPHETEENFRTIGRLAQHAGARVVVMVQVTRAEYPSPWDPHAFSEARRRVRALASEQGWPVIELSRLADYAWPGSEGYLRDFCHLSPKGHEVVGKLLVEMLEGMRAAVTSPAW